MTPVPSWYPLCQTLTCGYGALVLLALYSRGYASFGADLERARRRDRGLLHLACALLVWVVGAWFGTESIWGDLLSILNSSFLLLAIRELDHTAAAIERLSRRSWTLGVVAISVVAASITLWTWRAWTPGSIEARLPESSLSTATLFVLFASFWRSFGRRGFPALQLLSALVIAIEVAAQGAIGGWLPLVRGDPHAWLLGAKLMLVLTYVALAYTWSHERGEEHMAETPAAPEPVPAGSPPVDLRRSTLLLGPKRGSKYRIALRHADGTERAVECAERRFACLLDLAVARKTQDPASGGWRVPTDIGYSRDAVRNHISDVQVALGLGRKSPLGFLVESARDNPDRRRIALAPDRIELDVDGLTVEARFEGLLRPLRPSPF